MVNIKKFDDSNPRVLISTRLKTKQQLNELVPEENTYHKKLTKLIQDAKYR